MNRLIKAFEPFENCVACLPVELQTEAGIIIPETVQKKANLGRVIAVGKGIEGIELGDRLTYKQCFLVEMPRQPDEPAVDAKGKRFANQEQLIIIEKASITGRVPAGAFSRPADDKPVDATPSPS